ncbi:hypothetical protein GF369_02600 [Candidatus Peregrinibacteria bacterium]|nr:hypothetical protein [Candidatus Peregrinibacteria bacterium]
MPIVFTLISLFFPRLVILILWGATGWFNGLFDTFIWPILGFLFMPYTFLWYSVVHHWFGGSWGGVPITMLIIAIIFDLIAISRIGR